jgi:hypothetical protein
MEGSRLQELKESIIKNIPKYQKRLNNKIEQPTTNLQKHFTPRPKGRGKAAFAAWGWGSNYD